ncbi:MAG TPA: universal stress protein [Pyrinomonadaceae bacterium]|jgi:nucleotide-binding universal stress UspA family protein|nr:universal stress protein [Pyrinomonadaceae bacterium]
MKVLVAVDSLTTLDVLLNEMAGRSWPAGTEAQVLSVVDDGDVPMKVWREEGYRPSAVRLEMEKRGEEISALAVERLREIGIPAGVVIMRGDPAYLISFAARKWAADLILIRAHNRKDFRRRLLGSVAKSVVESAPCSVEVVRTADVTSETGEFRVLLATDGSAASIAASRAIAEMNWPENSEVRVVSAVNPIVYSLEELGLTRDTRTERAHRAIGNAVHALSRAPVRISAEVIAGRAAGRIVERAKHWQAHLIVLGTNERRGLSRLLFGSTSAAVANRAHCSVRVVRGSDVPQLHESLQRTKGLQESKKAA